MDKKEALNIIRMIAKGEDPYKESRSKYLPENKPKTLKALCTVIASLFPMDDEVNETFSCQPLVFDNLQKNLIENFFSNLEKDSIFDALEKTDLKKDEAAKILGISYSKLLGKIKKHNIGKDIRLKILLRAVETDYREQLSRFSLNEYLEIIEKISIQKALESTSGYKQAAAELLGISFRALRYRIDKLETTSSISSIKADYFKHSSEISLDIFLKTVEKLIIEKAIKEKKGKKTEAAKRLGISFRTLRYRIDKLGIE
jgi:DNA-binding NtrC family response regulator